MGSWYGGSSGRYEHSIWWPLHACMYGGLSSIRHAAFARNSLGTSILYKLFQFSREITARTSLKRAPCRSPCLLCFLPFPSSRQAHLVSPICAWSGCIDVLIMARGLPPVSRGSVPPEVTLTPPTCTPPCSSRRRCSCRWRWRWRSARQELDVHAGPPKTFGKQAQPPHLGVPARRKAHRAARRPRQVYGIHH